MLVLSRKIREQILIPGMNIRLTIVSVGKNRVQLGIEAPQGIQITRPETAQRTVDVDEHQIPEVACATFADISSV